jgi:hypothetical protein
MMQNKIENKIARARSQAQLIKKFREVREETKKKQMEKFLNDQMMLGLKRKDCESERLEQR